MWTVRLAPFALLALPALALVLVPIALLIPGVPDAPYGPAILVLISALFVAAIVIALVRSEEIVIDNVEIRHQPLLGRPRAFLWAETFAIQVTGWTPSRVDLVFRVVATALIIAVPTFLEAPLWIGLVFAAFWLSMAFLAGELRIAVAPHGTRHADPGPNVPISRTLIGIVGKASMQRVAALLLEAAEEHGVPAWSTWDDRRRTRPRY